MKLFSDSQLKSLRLSVSGIILYWMDMMADLTANVCVRVCAVYTLGKFSHDQSRKLVHTVRCVCACACIQALFFVGVGNDMMNIECDGSGGKKIQTGKKQRSRNGIADTDIVHGHVHKGIGLFNLFKFICILYFKCRRKRT